MSSFSVFANQRNVTRNQSTLDIQRQDIFIYGPRYQNETFINSGSNPFTAATGILVARQTVAPFGVIPIEDSKDLANVIGILRLEGGEIELASGESTQADVCISSDIDTTLLDLPTDVTLNTKVGDKCLKDVLTSLGFVLFNVTELSKFDN